MPPGQGAEDPHDKPRTTHPQTQRNDQQGENAAGGARSAPPALTRGCTTGHQVPRNRTRQDKARHQKESPVEPTQLLRPNTKGRPSAGMGAAMSCSGNIHSKDTHPSAPRDNSVLGQGPPGVQSGALTRSTDAGTARHSAVALLGVGS